jgi:hypothetical protein
MLESLNEEHHTEEIIGHAEKLAEYVNIYS